jgi:hypothetical protein
MGDNVGGRAPSRVRAMVTAVDALVILLVVLTVATGLGPAGWLAGVAFAVLGWAVLTEALRRAGETSFGPAGRLTLARSVLVGAVAALVVETTDPRPDPVLAIIIIATVALAMRVVGLRAEASAFDRRFAAEVDAFFVLALSAFVATKLGVWVLAVGLTWYAFSLAGKVLPWLRAPLPASRIRTVITVAPSVVLTAVVAGLASRLLPDTTAVVLTALALVAFVGSVAQDVWWLHRNRGPAPEKSTDAEPTRRPIVSWLLTGLAGLLVLTAFVGPNRLSQLTVGAFTRIPLEGLMAAGLVLVLPAKARRVAIVVVGAGLGLLTIVKFIDMGFYEVFDRPFHLVFDWSFFGPALDFVGTSYGHIGQILAVIGVVLLVLGLLAGMTLAVRRLTRISLGHRTGATYTLAALGIIWLVCALVGVQLSPQQPVASRSAADHVYDDVRAVRQGLVDGENFAAQARDDKYRYTPGNELLTGLRGKDVLFVFVESYGRVAIENSDSAPVIDPLLDASTDRLRAAGYDSRSAFLTSPVSGGGSWLAHATLQTGLWVDNPQRRTSLADLDRMTLSIAFNRAGWRTVGSVPANTTEWPEGEIYHFDKVYDSRNVGYKGPKFSYAPVPDQYTLNHFEQNERKKHGPVMAEIDLISSHTPFTPAPDMVGWDELGDGSIYNPMPAKGPQPGEVWPDPTKVRAAYTKSIDYALTSLFSYIETYGDDDLVVVFLGDHQPQPIVSSQEGSRDVPITVVSSDPAVMDSISSWGWQEGLNPSPKAPVWPMDSFRDRFLAAYGPTDQSNQAASPPR